MSYDLKAVTSKPAGLWRLDENTPFPDHSGHGNTATIDAVTNGAGIVKGASKSLIVSDQHRLKIPSSLFKVGQDFSVEAWVRPIRKGLDVPYTSAALINNPSQSGNVNGFTAPAYATLTAEDEDFFGRTVKTMHGYTDNNSTFSYNNIPVDINKTYRLRLWKKEMQRATGPGFGQFYVGMYAYDAANANIGIDSVAQNGVEDTTPQTNSYFVYSTPSSASLYSWIYYELYIFGINTAPSDMVNVGVFPAEAVMKNNLKFISGTDHITLRWLSWSNVSGIFRDTYVADYDFQEVELVGPAQWEAINGVENTGITILGNDNSPVLSFEGAGDGLAITGTEVGFSTDFQSTGGSAAITDIQQDRAIHVVGVHTKSKNLLYVDGVLADYSDVSDIQSADNYSLTDGFLYSGISNSKDELMINGVATYTRALDAAEIAQHFINGRPVVDIAESATLYGGDTLLNTIDDAPIFLKHVWDSNADWNTGDFINTAALNDELVTQKDASGVSLAGTWTGMITLSASSSTSIYGIVVDWIGTGATIDVSLDGTTWETVSRGEKPTTVPEGYNPTDVEMYIRVSFPGGIQDDDSYVESLTVIGLDSGVLPETAGRTLTLISAAPEHEVNVLEFSDSAGIRVQSGGSVTISADSSIEALPIRTIEMWIKPVSTITIDTTGTEYFNGGTGQFNVGEWTLYHFIADANVAGTVTISGEAEIGSINVYPTALAAVDIQAIYNGFLGVDSLQVTSDTVVGITQSASAADIYAHDWSISPAG